MNDVIDYLDKQAERFVAVLSDFLRIPSVSANPDRAADVRRCAEHLAGHLESVGLENVRIFDTPRHPIVYADWLHADGAPTLLCYGHYDVQPDEPVELWETPPYEPTIKDGKLYARGATDDKGQLLCHVNAVEAFFAVRKALPINVKFIIEGEEEIASENLDAFIESHTDLLACDAVLVSDSSMPGPGIPAITYGLRGLAYMQVDVTGANTDLHSGSYGGAVQNAANALAELIASMKGPDGVVKIDGFYDNVLPLSDGERAELAKVPHDDDAYREELAVPELVGETGYTTVERSSARPTLDVNGVISGYTGQGAKTVLPAKASAKISMRLVPNQDPDRIEQLFRAHVKTYLPRGVTAEVKSYSGGQPFLTPLTEPALKKAGAALSKGFGKAPVFMREGGSIPVVSTLAEQLSAPVLLLGFGLHTEKAHAPNEHFDLENYRLGTRTIAFLLDELATGL